MAPERGDRSLHAGTEGLPRVFLQSLRTLFDILDDRRRGYVHLREIESRWRGAEAQELPAGVMEGLRQPGQPRGRGADAKSAGQSQGDSGHPGAGDIRRHQRGRAEHRRHTITNGMDFSMLKYMKELEQEKDFLLQGLELIDRARDWYHQHIQLMQEHQRLLGKKRTSADFPEGGQSHLGRLVPKLQEVNRCLGDLLSTAGKTANSSSALSRLVPVMSPASTGSQQAINMLKEQNRLLTKEVTDKSERITQLEQEKSALIKQLFEARAHNNHEMSQLDSTFI
ncbi:PREDICTED: suppressor APC domain-containing protein 2 [Ficedula albicollis]|uniref:suppressor APC domain-containing protein 2 n=1 Tax=Ficedula albicollis TaxID=59894 RepID=UPI0007AD8574|nr:PREDICTED: suppressor APC domain-containing protein 2 [Ficedula albicollis]